MFAFSQERWPLLTRSLAAVLLLLCAKTAWSAEPSEAERLLQAAQQALTANRLDDAARALAAAEKLPADADLERRVAVCRRELFTVVRLREIYNDDPVNAGGFDRDLVIAAYRETFHGYGLDPETATDEMKQRGSASPIVMHLLAALDNWAIVVKRTDKAGRCQLLDFADALDESALRREVRAAVRTEDRAQLVRLASEADLKALSAATLLLLAKMLDRAGETAAHLDLLQRGLVYYPSDLWLQLHLGYAFDECSPPKFKEALRCFQAVLALSPNCVTAHLCVTDSLIKLKRPAEAEAVARQCVRLLPNSSYARYVLAAALMVTDQPTQAETTCREVLRLDRANTCAILLLGQIHATQKKWAEAETELRSVLALVPDEAETTGWLIVTLYAQGKHEEAEQLTKAALNRYKDSFSEMFNLAGPFLESERWADAEAALREALRLRKDDFKTLMYLSKALLKQNKSLDVELACREALRVNPANVDTRCLLGGVLLLENMFEETEATFREVLRLDQEIEGAWSGLGVALGHQKKYREAESIFRNGLLRFPQSAQLHTNLGIFLAIQNRDREAEGLYCTALRRDPDYVLARVNLVYLLRRANRYEEAKALLREAVRANKDDSDAWGTLAELLERGDEYAEAETALRERVRIEGGGWREHLALANAYEFRGQFEAALAEMRLLKPEELTLSSALPIYLKQLEREDILDRQIPALLRGEVQPAEETLALANVCLFKHHFVGAVRFFQQGFQALPSALEDGNLCFRGRAAFAAASAGCGQGDDAPATEAERAVLRRQALAWLRDDLAMWIKVTNENESARTGALKLLERCQHATYLDGVRESKSLARLPQEERAEWCQFWNEVEALRLHLEALQQ